MVRKLHLHSLGNFIFVIVINSPLQSFNVAVFYVTDHEGKKVRDTEIMEAIKRVKNAFFGDFLLVKLDCSYCFTLCLGTLISQFGSISLSQI